MTPQFDLFGDDEPAPGLEQLEPAPKLERRLKRSRKASWQVADHACRFCFGRVLQRAYDNEVFEVRCAECGAHAEGPPRMLCCCGADCGDLGHVLECFRNPNVTNEVPHEILVRERPVKRASLEQTAPMRPVNIRDV